MAVESGFDTSGIEQFNEELVRLAQVQFPRETKSFMRKEATAFNRLARADYRSKTKKKTGNLLKGIKKGSPYLYNGDEYQIRVKNIAPHAHLIEYGHHIKGNTERMVAGRHIMGETDTKFKSTFPNDVDKFIDEMLDKGLS